MAATMINNSRNFVKQITRSDGTRLWKHLHTRVNKFYRTRERPDVAAKTWVQRLKEIEVHLQDGTNVNIGVSAPSVKKLSRKERRKLQTEKNLVELERHARKEELVIPVEEITQGEMNSQKQCQLHNVASHYGIFKDLFDSDYFYPQSALTVLYEAEQEAEADIEGEEITFNPVFYGNVLDPSETSTEPAIEFNGEEGKLYTLCMTAPDSHLQDNNLEYLHWMVYVCRAQFLQFNSLHANGNIPGSSVQDGSVLCDYLRPFPVKGTGFHRYVFVLYQHDSAIDFSEETKSHPCTSLRERTFSSRDFYRKYKDSLKPVGLAFFQAEWDETVRKTFHHILDMGEPRFEFIAPLKYIPKQQHWPLKEPFNVYMDRYRDVKDINEEVLREKLKNAHPFMPRPPPRKYPNVYKPDRSQPSWLRQKINDQLLRKAQWKGLDD